MAKKILSICIPTFNRGPFLIDCLNSIVSQFDDREIYDNVEVIISDNASTDKTTEIVTGFTNEYENIKYFRNSENMGFDRNLLQTIEQSSGEYCLTIGDDDAFLPSSLEELLNKIKEFQLPYYMLNSWGYDHDLIKPIMSESNRKISEDQFFEELSKFVIKIKGYMNLVGNFGGMSHLFNRKMWIDYKDKQKYVGTQAVHLFIILSVFKNSKCAILAKPVIKTRNNNMRWNTFPGLETYTKRSERTTQTVLWISDLYNLSLSPFSVKLNMRTRAYWIIFKDIIKKILITTKIRH